MFLSLCDLQGKTLFETEILNEDYPISEINSTITNMIKTAIEYVPLETKLLGFGLSIPGHYNKDSGSIITNNPIWESFNLLNVIKRFNFPFIVKNNIDCMAIGQYLYNPHNTPDNFIFLHAG
ncbi:ROK family protein, partial [Burkholderia contaminans]|nr:ROK family protein [Burkholderia contaminans]